MNNDRPRTLAYHFAKELNHQELEKVAGGGGFCHKPTFKVSGMDGTWDTAIDISIDW